jgi:leucyl aminopeptidase (aminopeptidase T)
MPENWDRAVGHFRQSLPSGISDWIILAEAGAHGAIIGSLRDELSVAEVVVLGQDPPERLTSAAAQYARQVSTGLLDFALAGADVRYGGQYQPGLAMLSEWPARRCRLCVDVWDENFAELFAEPPGDVTERCAAMAAKLRGKGRLTYTGRGNGQLEFDCSASEWIIYSAAEDYDYTLPSGEIACLPGSVDGRADVDGWLVGTIPFGPKYGHIATGDLALSFRAGQITAVHGGRQDLCADVERVLDRDPGLRAVGELGLGQSLAVRAARDLHPRGCMWHEKILGLHLGLGAELPETSDIRDRVTGHHVDVVFAAGSLSDGDGETLLTW